MMAAEMEPIQQFKCTYRDCDMSFKTEKAMRNHKKCSDEHDYCNKCNEDFDSHEDYAMHKIARPEEHGKACRVCGEEFKSESGLKRHIERVSSNHTQNLIAAKQFQNHKVDQKLTCFGCQKSFYRACLFIEHLEFGHCNLITPTQFHGHIIHKHLITEFLKGGSAWNRFKQKTSTFEAAQDDEEEGGIGLDDPLGRDEEIEEVQFEALKADTPPGTPLSLPCSDPFPPLPSTTVGSPGFGVASRLGVMSLDAHLERSTTVATAVPEDQLHIAYDLNGSPQNSIIPSENRQVKVWGSRKGKSTSNVLFPNAKPTPTPSEFSIAAHDHAMEQEHGINIMRTRFWDPISSDWNPEKFFNSIVSKYYCPFICE